MSTLAKPNTIRSPLNTEDVDANFDHIYSVVKRILSGDLSITFTGQAVLGVSAIVSALYGSALADGDLTLNGTLSAAKTNSYIFMQPTGGGIMAGNTTESDATGLFNLFGTKSSSTAPLSVYDTAAIGTGVGGKLLFGGKTTSGGAYGKLAQIEAYKENATSANLASTLYFATSNAAGTLSNWLSISSTGAVNVSGALTASSTLNVSGASTLNSTLNVSGASTLAALSVSSISSGAGTFSTLSCSGNLAVNTNKFTANATSGNAVIAGSLDVYGCNVKNGQNLQIEGGDLVITTGDITIGAGGDITLTSGGNITTDTGTISGVLETTGGYIARKGSGTFNSSTGGNVATMTNAINTGNPAKWFQIYESGNTYYVPAW